MADIKKIEQKLSLIARIAKAIGIILNKQGVD